MGSVISGITDAIGLTDTADPGDRALKAAQLQAGYQEQALDYLKEQEQLPTAFREAALTGMGAEAGFTFDEQGNIVSEGLSLEERARQSPFYTGAQQGGEEAILRQAGATGGLRSGNVQDALYRADQDLFLRSYANEQNKLSALSGLPSNTNQIAGAMGGIGQTLAQGQVARAQADIGAQNQLFSDLTGLAQVGTSAYTAGLL